MHLLFDIESTGLLRRGSQIHCIVARHLFDENAAPLVFDTVQGNVDEGVELLQQANCLAGHNIINYDLPLLKELYPQFKLPKVIHDTLIFSRLYFPDMKERDHSRNIWNMPKKLFGSHGLEAWGHRLGEYKGDFGKQNDWTTYTKDMLEYCIQDTTVNLRLYAKICRLLPEENRLIKL